MDKKPAMGFSTLNTILNTAPLIIQGATRLIKLIKDRDKPETEDIPATVEGLKDEMLRINKRLDENYESDIQQINLIEELARQNELLATSLKKTNKQLNMITLIALISLLVGIVVFLRMLNV